MNRAEVSLYDLLPAYVRFRDAEAGESLKAIFDALQIPFDQVRDDIDGLYRAWFIETCEDWMVPYLGDLLGVRGFDQSRHLFPTVRSRIGNALAYRRSKGTPATLERAARDVTGWPCHVIEYRQIVSTSSSLIDTAGVSGTTLDLRQHDVLEALGGPFDSSPHLPDFKPADSESPPLAGPGGYGLEQLGLAFWRLEGFPVAAGTPAEIGGGRYTFHPFGLDAPLFNAPQTAGETIYRAGEAQLPVPLRRLALAEEIAALRSGRQPATDYLAGDPVFRLLVAEEGEGRYTPIAPAEIEICDLDEWEPVPLLERPRHLPPARACVDPERGRFVLPEEKSAGTGRRVRVDYLYGGCMDLGGGPYTRMPEPEDRGPDVWRAVVASECGPQPEGSHVFPSLAAAVTAWGKETLLPIPPPFAANLRPAAGEIRIADSASYGGDLVLDLEGRKLAIVAADGCRPCLRGRVRIEPHGPMAGAEMPSERVGGDSELHLDGLWVEGGIEVARGLLLSLRHCTVAPRIAGTGTPSALRLGKPGFADQPPGEGDPLLVEAHFCILGALDFGHGAGRLRLADCIVDGGEELAIQAHHAGLEAARCTVFGGVVVGEIRHAIDVLFTGGIYTLLTSEGEVRFSYLPTGTRVPAQERCVGEGADAATRTDAESAPSFTATTYGHPAYAQLSPANDSAIRRGGENGNEIGVYNALRQSDRLDNLPQVLDEFLPWGMSARPFFVT